MSVSEFAFHQWRHPREVRTDQVSVLEIEAIELIACLLGVMYVLVDHKRRTLRVVRDTLADLPGGENQDVSKRLVKATDKTRMLLPNRPKFAKEVKQLLRGYVVASKAKSAILLVSANGTLQEDGKCLDARRSSGWLKYVLEVLDEENPVKMDLSARKVQHVLQSAHA